jgi:hypothetical protein
MKKTALNVAGQSINNFNGRNPVEEFLKTEYGIENVMDYEFDDLKDKDRSDYIVLNVRGNMQLRKGQIRTVKESDERFNRVSNLDFERLLRHK